jgi:endoglucanase
MQTSWGTPSDKQALDKDLAKLKLHFVDKGIPVIIGEYGSTKEKKDQNSVRDYMLTVAERVYELGMCPMLWDIQGGQFDQKKLRFDDPKLAEGFLQLGAKARQ